MHHGGFQATITPIALPGTPGTLIIYLRGIVARSRLSYKTVTVIVETACTALATELNQSLFDKCFCLPDRMSGITGARNTITSSLILKTFPKFYHDDIYSYFSSTNNTYTLVN